MAEKKGKSKAKAATKTKAAAKAAKGAAKAVVKVKPMTKSALIAKMAESLELPRRKVSDFLDVLTDLAVSETKRAGQFQLHGIGKLVKATRKARTGVNPKTKEKIQIPEKTVLKFRFAKACKDAIV